MSLFNETLLWLMKRRMPRIEGHFTNPLELQHTSLDELIFSSRNTEWGKKYGYSDIGNYEQFKARVPISTYEEIFPYIDRMMHESKISFGQVQFHGFLSLQGPPMRAVNLFQFRRNR
jgi:hypothetical protein